MKKFGNSLIRLAIKGKDSEIVECLSPVALATNWDKMPSPEVWNIFEAFGADSKEIVFTRVTPPFNKEELIKATRNMFSRKSDGPSGIPREIFKLIVLVHPQSIPQFSTTAWHQPPFPLLEKNQIGFALQGRWKTGRLAV